MLECLIVCHDLLTSRHRQVNIWCWNVGMSYHMSWSLHVTMPLSMSLEPLVMTLSSLYDMTPSSLYDTIRGRCHDSYRTCHDSYQMTVPLTSLMSHVWGCLWSRDLVMSLSHVIISSCHSMSLCLIHHTSIPRNALIMIWGLYVLMSLSSLYEYIMSWHHSPCL